MAVVIIDGKEYHADEAVVNELHRYAEIINRAKVAYNALRDSVIEVRALQKEFFRHRDTRILDKSKDSEIRLDDLLRNKKDKVVQKKIF
jgi:hypothetical protein